MLLDEEYKRSFFISHKNRPVPDTQTAGLDTFPRLLLYHAKVRADRPAIREKDLGIWQVWSWDQMKTEILTFANGLAAMGFKRGDKIAIIGSNRPRLYWGMTAVQCLGGIPVPVYHDSVADEMAYVLKHAEVTFALVEDQEQVDKILEVQTQCPALKTIIYDDSRGLRDYDHTHMQAFDDVQRAGKSFSDKNPEFLSQEINKCSGSDISIFLYTSGTTGKPKGVVLTNDNILITARNSAQIDGLNDKDEALAYLPMAWVGDNIFSYGQAYAVGFCINCPEGEDTVATDLREIGPTFYFAPPRVFENLLTSVTIRMKDASKLKQMLFGYFMNIAHRTGISILNNQPVGFLDRFLYQVGELLVYGPLKNSMGFNRIRLAYTAGEAIGPEIFDFFRSLGINIKQLYGQTEASVFITAQPDGEVFADTVGVPSPGVEIKIAESGEVIYRGPGVFHSYYKNPEATEQTKDAEGWVKTGDAGYFDDKGHLKIIDRVKDVGKLNSGELFAPKYIENKLKFFPQIKEAVAFGHEKDYVTAMVNIDLDAVGNWAERHNIPYSSYQELAAHPQVFNMIMEDIEKVNQDLAADEKLSNTQIKRFLILHKELDADDGELTRTRKVRRRIISERYSQLIDALYSNRNQCHVKTEVTFEDGRKGFIEADLDIKNVKTFEPLRKAS